MFYGTQSSLPHSQRPANSHILSEMNPVQPLLRLLKTQFIVIPHRQQGLPSGLFPLGFLTQILYAPLHSTIRDTRPVISLFLILSPEQYLVRCTDHKKSSVCSLFHCPGTSSVLGPNILLCALFSNILVLRSSLNVRDKF